MALPATNQHYTYADYLNWPDDERWELIGGHAWAIPTPDTDHQRLVGDLLGLLWNYLCGMPCEPFVAPFDVRLPRAGTADQQVDTVVQPDIVVVCDPAKLERRGCLGAPDWVIEVLSPGTTARDMGMKRAQYERHGVREYWLVHPADRLVMAYRLAEGAYGKPEVVAGGEKIASAVFPELVIDVTALFARIAQQP